MRTSVAAVCNARAAAPWWRGAVAARPDRGKFVALLSEN
jgi:hypothetical protein